MIASRACAVLALGACLSRTHRYIDVPGRAGEARAQFEERALANGFDVKPDGNATRVRDTTVSEHDEPWKRAWSRARFYQLDPQRTRIELEHGLEQVGDAALPPAPARVIEPDRPGVTFTPDRELGWSERLGIGLEPVVAVGVIRDPEYSASAQVDTAMRIPVRVHELGRVDAAVRPRWAVLVTPGLGFRINETGFVFHPEVLVSLSRQSAAWYVPWSQIPTGKRALFDLSIAGLMEQGGRRGFEVGIAVRNPAWGGVYARAGWLGASGELRGGPTVSAGIEAGRIPSGIMILGLILLAGAVVKAGEAVGIDSGE
jgi:hypothetical protein